MALVVVGVEQTVGRRPLDHLRELPAEVHRILHADVEALPTLRWVHVRGIAGEQHAAGAVRRRLPRHVREAGDPRRGVRPEVGAVRGDERVAEIIQRWIALVLDVLLPQHDAVRPAAFGSVDGTDAPALAAGADHGLFAHLDLADDPAGRGVQSRELDAGDLPHQAAPAIAPDEVGRSQHRAIGQLDVDTLVVLREPDDFPAAEHRHAELVDPGPRGCARCRAARARARSCGASGSR